jgi:hypothetical protein
MYVLRRTLVNPRYDFVDLQYTAEVRRLKPTMYVVFNWAREKFIVKDVDAEGMHYVYLIVQEPNGAYRDFDERTLATIRKDMWGGPNVSAIIQNLQAIEDARERRLAAESADFEYGFRSDFKWAGKDVTPSVIWRERSTRKEEIIRARS